MPGTPTSTLWLSTPTTFAETAAAAAKAPRGASSSAGAGRGGLTRGRGRLGHGRRRRRLGGGRRGLAVRVQVLAVQALAFFLGSPERLGVAPRFRAASSLPVRVGFDRLVHRPMRSDTSASRHGVLWLTYEAGAAGATAGKTPPWSVSAAATRRGRKRTTALMENEPPGSAPPRRSQAPPRPDVDEARAPGGVVHGIGGAVAERRI